MSTDLTLPSARSERNALADRTDVLNKVGVLRTLPDQPTEAEIKTAIAGGVA